MRPIEILAEKMTMSQRTLGIAESCTGGLLSHHITNIPGSSNFFEGGVVAYSDAAKMKILAVTEECLKTNGAVSERTALAMADGARDIFSADIGIGITGIAGPDGGSEEKPVGLVHIAISDVNDFISMKFEFDGDRRAIKDLAIEKAVDMSLLFLAEH